MSDVSLKGLVKDNTVSFQSLRKGVAMYGLVDPESGDALVFPVDVADIGDATLKATDKAIYFMRYIREAIERGELVKAQ